MARLVRMDATGHTVVAEWKAGDAAAVVRAREVLAAEMEDGLLAVATRPDGSAEQVRELPLDAELVVLRRPIAGG